MSRTGTFTHEQDAALGRIHYPTPRIYAMFGVQPCRTIGEHVQASACFAAMHTTASER